MTRGMARAIAAATIAAALLVGAYLALGGGGDDVAAPPDPCRSTSEARRAGVTGTVERLTLTALNATACELGVSRERLLLVLGGETDPPPALEDEERRADAFRAGLRRAVDEEEQAGRLGAAQGAVLRSVIELAPIDVLLDQFFRER